MNMNNKLICDMEIFAKENNVPIMIKDTIEYIVSKIKENKISSILEIGTAIGYSTIIFGREVNNITSVERDIERYNLATTNVKISGLKNIKLIFCDALDLDINEKFDMVIIDAAKSKNVEFFEKYKNNLNKDGIIIIDNMNFHGLVGNSSAIRNRRLRSLVKKLESFWSYIDNQEEYSVEHINIGDGIVVCKKKNIL